MDSSDPPNTSPASDSSLGARRALYTSATTFRDFIYFLGFFSLVLLWGIPRAVRRRGGGLPETADTILFGFVTGAAVVAGYMWWHRRKSLEVCERGFVYRRGRAVRYISWEQVGSIRVVHDQFSEGIVPRYAYVDTDGGRRIKLGTWFKESTELVESLLRYSRRARLTQAKKTLARGESISFGPLTATTAGLVKGAKVLRWADMAEATLTSEKKTFPELLVHERGQRDAWFRCRAGKVPNADILGDLAADRRRFGC